MYAIPFVLLIMAIVWLIYRKQWQNLVRPVEYRAHYSGSPHYIAGSTSGSPLSDLGSHCGFKSAPEREEPCSTAVYATTASFGAGRVCDFSIGLSDQYGQPVFDRSHRRTVHFNPHSIEEKASAERVTLYSRLLFLQSNLALLEIEWIAKSELSAFPTLSLHSTRGRDVENPYPHLNGFTFFKKEGGGLALKNYYRVPGQKLRLFFLPSSGEAFDKKVARGLPVKLAAGEKSSWSVVISFSADSDRLPVERAQRALRNLRRLKDAAVRRFDRFERSLPLERIADKDWSGHTFRLAAWALQNSLYRPRGSMSRCGSVPAKVYFPFFWGWDTPQHVVGLSEWNPGIAGEVLLTQLEGSCHDAPGSSYKLKIKGLTILDGNRRNQIPSKIDDSLKGVLDFYSQPPLQSWAAVRVSERLEGAPERERFLGLALPLLRANLHWWEDNRRLPNGFFSYINGLESGLDDSPRFYPPSFLPSFIIGLLPRFFSAVDLNCWVYQSYLNIAGLCRLAGLKDEAASYRLKGIELGDRIDRDLWSPGHEAWLDRRNGKFIDVITPAVWWPAFVGAASSLEKVRAVIENYLLRPEKFWGSHGIPSVAFDDKAYNSRKDGYYWRGQVWMINNYVALEVLHRYGYFAEAEELHGRIIGTIGKQHGLFETYNAETGAVGWSSRGPGDPAVLQFGMSSAWATQVILRRYQHFCYVFDDTRQLKGHIQWAAAFGNLPAFSPPGIETDPEGAVLIVRTLDSPAHRVPRIALESLDGKPLLQSARLGLYFKDSGGKQVEIDFYWRGEHYRVKSGLKYLLRPFAPSKKLSSA